MRHFLFSAILLALVMTSCKPAAPSSQTSADPVDTGRPSLAGLYQGVTPCADCAGIETSLGLSDGMVFTLELKYAGKEPPEVIQQSGRYAWSDSGDMIILGGIDSTRLPTRFLVDGERLIQLDLSGNRITGDLADRYILSKL